jgi:hypothetical protein
MGFVCSVCGDFHAERLLDIRLSLPDPIFALADDEREARAWLADDFAVLDEERFFVRGLLELPIPELETRFGYGTWVEIESKEFQQLLEHWEDPEQFPPVEGTVANELAPYTGTEGLRATLSPVSVETLPSVKLDDAAHPLVADQQAGISADRSDELAATVLHAG